MRAAAERGEEGGKGELRINRWKKPHKMNNGEGPLMWKQPRLGFVIAPHLSLDLMRHGQVRHRHFLLPA